MGASAFAEKYSGPGGLQRWIETQVRVRNANTPGVKPGVLVENGGSGGIRTH